MLDETTTPRTPAPPPAPPALSPQDRSDLAQARSRLPRKWLAMERLVSEYAKADGQLRRGS